jgi:hypothetical protein
MKRYIISWGTQGMAILSAPNAIEAMEILCRKHSSGDVKDRIVSLRKIEEFEIISHDQDDVPF